MNHVMYRKETVERRPLWLMLSTALMALCIALSLGLVPKSAFAAAPLADTIIGNQASATYVDANSVTRNVSSNTVETKVLAVYGFTLTQNNSKAVAPGGTVYFPHTLNNTGNTVDTFNFKFTQLAATPGTALSNTSCTIFLDANADGQPDNPASPLYTVTDCNAAVGVGTSVALGPVAASSQYNFVVAVQVAPGAENGNTASLKIDAQSQGDVKICTVNTAGFTGTDACTVTAAGTNTDTLTVATGAIFEVIKKADKEAAKPGDTITYTLTIRNTGNSAGKTVITDVLGGTTIAGANTTDLEYVAASGRWSSTGSTVLTDDDDALVADGLGVELKYKVDPLTGVRTLTAELDKFPANTTQTITFQAKVKANAIAGNTQGVNRAAFRCPRSGATTPAETECVTNATTLTVLPFYAVTANASTTNASLGLGADGNTLATANDVVLIGSSTAGDYATKVSQGSVLTFENYVWNKGNNSDSFKVELVEGASEKFSDIGTMALFQSDGVTPLTNSTTPVIPQNYQGSNAQCSAPFIQDNTNKACGYKVVLKVTLNANVPTSNIDAAVKKKAVSQSDSTVFDVVEDRLRAEIVVPLVDLLNSAGGAEWTGIDGTGAITGATVAAKTTCTVYQITASGNCTGDSTSVSNKLGKALFPLFIRTNLAGTYNLSVKTNAAQATDITVAPGATTSTAIQSGWNVRFYTSTDPTCTTLGSSTSTVNVTSAQTLPDGGGNIQPVQVACAEVVPPANAVPTTNGVAFYFTVTNGVVTTGTSTKRDDVIIATERSAAFSPNNTNQVAPGGTWVYSHILTNNGNSNIPLGAGSCTMASTNTTGENGGVGPSNGTAGWQSVLYIDVNNNGILDDAEVVQVTDASAIPAGTLYTDGSSYSAVNGLEKGKSIRYFVKVLAPAGAQEGTSNATLTTLTIAGTGCPVQTSLQVVDTTTVVGGQVRLFKEQAHLAACDTMPAAGAFSVTQVSAKPGECVCYRIKATNDGSSAVNNVKITDYTPTYTTYQTTPAASCNNAGTSLTGADFTEPSNNSTGGVVCGGATGFVMPAATSAELQFCVKIDR